MSTYNGRHGPNVSQYLRDLNTINPQDTTTTTEDAFNIEDDLALFTNTQFFDFDSGQNMDFQAQPVKADVDAAQSTSSPSEDVTSAPSVMSEMPNLDFMSGDFNFPDFNNAFTTATMNSFPENAASFPPLQPNHIAAPVAQPQAQFSPGNVKPTDKRKADAIASSSPDAGIEDSSRVAAEEDKRRRNTAASARFRIKKKQREQALEKSAKEMSEKISSLESKVSQLETENKWLKNLLVEKNEGSEDITALWKEFTKHASERTKAASAQASKGSVAKEER
ncbi:hypothetical protein HIM_00166 [Hirsutella minnesotensis 3608]|nr:hypothetical protein HIM_00166 [Hirsutella minnesotensis 3608]